LIACQGAKVDVNPPFSLGICMLLPLRDPEIYCHVVIERYEEFDGQMFYYFKHGKKHVKSKKKLTAIENDIGRAGKQGTFVEEHGLLFLEQREEEWLGKHDIPQSELDHYSNDIFPVIIGQKNLVDHWINVELQLSRNPICTMGDILQLRSTGSKFTNLKVLSTRNERRERHVNQIWVNSVPKNMDKGKFFIILSPSHNLYEENVSELNQRYSDAKLAAIKQSDIPENLLDLGISNRSLSVVALLKECNE
jgi:hypothetical protein